MDNPLLQAGAVAAAISAIIGTLLMLGKVVTLVWKLNRRVGHALDIIIGAPAVGEIPERPGVMARLERIEKEVKPNGGTSIKDQVSSIKQSIERVDGLLLGHLAEHGQGAK